LQLEEQTQPQQRVPDRARTTIPLAGPQHVRTLESHPAYRFGLSYGRIIYRLRWLIIALWLVGVAAAVPFAAQVTSVLGGSGYSAPTSESSRVPQLLVSNLHQAPSQLLVVFQSPSTPVSDPAYANEVDAFASQARGFPHVTGVTVGGTGKDGNTTFVTVNFDESASAVTKQLASFRTLLPGNDATPSGPARAYLTGDPAVEHDITQISGQDVEHAELAAMPIALVVLLIIFGTLVAAVMPLLLAGVAVPVALAIIYAIAVHMQTSVFVLNIASIIGLGISIDYSLFMVRRFRAELGRGRTPREATAWTVATAGEAILFSGLTVMIGFSGLFLIGVPFMTSFGMGGAVVVGAAVLASLTLLPALLGVLGPRINALHIPLIGRFVTRAAHEEGVEPEGRRGFWQKWALAVMRRPLVVMLVAVALLLGIGWPVLSLNMGSTGTASLPATSESRQALDILSAQFPKIGSDPILIVAQTPDGSSILTAENVARIANLSDWLQSQDHVSGVTSLTSFPATPGSPAPTEAQLAQLYSTGAYTRMPALSQLVKATTNGATTLVTVQTNAALNSAASEQLVNAIRANRGQAEGLTLAVGGTQASAMDSTSYLYGNFPRAILFIMVATYILLLLMFRSLLLPLKAIVMNVLSVSAAYGVLVYVFQWGHFSNLLGFTSAGAIDNIIPILMFCILFGLSMDYEVFLLSAIREEWLLTHNNRWAVARGLAKTGGVITNAALLFIIVTGAFTFTRLVTTKEIGLGMAVAVAVDATIIRTLLVPATMRLLGRWNWWLPGLPLPPKQGGESARAARSAG
jgi:uncharacterized membrane protein YdfJ with MMPL/SSD domain